MKPAAPLSIPLKPSRRLLAVQLGAHLLAVLAVLLSTIPGWLAALLLAAVGLSLSRWRKADLPASLILHGDGRCEKVGADDTANEVVVLPQTVVLSWLVVLRHRQQGRTGAWVLVADSLDAEDFRRLRLWLRWRATEPQPA
jgi:toxin CptA